MNKPENTPLKKPRCNYDRSNFKKCIIQPHGKRFKIGRHDATLILIATLAEADLTRLIDIAFQNKVSIISLVFLDVDIQTKRKKERKTIEVLINYLCRVLSNVNLLS